MGLWDVYPPCTHRLGPGRLTTNCRDQQSWMSAVLGTGGRGGGAYGQKVGGSSPSERAEQVLVSGQISAAGLAEGPRLLPVLLPDLPTSAG
jgi:hypothetical protein